MEELKNVLALRQEQADNERSRAALARRRGGQSSGSEGMFSKPMGRSSEVALKDAVDVFSTYDPAFPKAQSLEVGLFTNDSFFRMGWIDEESDEKVLIQKLW